MIQEFINKFKLCPEVVSVVAITTPDNVLAEINSRKTFEINEGEVEGGVMHTIERTTEVTVDNTVLLDCVLNLNGQHVKLAYVMHKEDLTSTNEEHLVAGIEHAKEYHAKSELTQWMFRNRSQAICYCPLDYIDEEPKPLPVLRTKLGSLAPLDQLMNKFRELPFVSMARLHQHNEMVAAVEETGDPDGVKITCIVTLKDNSTEIVQFSVAKKDYSNLDKHQEYIDYVTNITTKLNDAIK